MGIKPEILAAIRGPLETERTFPARTVELTLGPDVGDTRWSLTLAFPEGPTNGIGGGTYPDAEGTDLPNANLYLSIDGEELGSLFFHRTADGKITATLGRYEEAAGDWEPRESLPETSWRKATPEEVKFLDHDGPYSEEPLPAHIIESRGTPETGWEVRV